MRPENLFMTEDGVLKLGYFGFVTQAEYYSKKKTEWIGIRSFAPEVFEGEYVMKSDLWSFGIVLIELLGITPYDRCDPYFLPDTIRRGMLPFNESESESEKLIDFLKKCFVKDVNARWSVNELMNVCA